MDLTSAVNEFVSSTGSSESEAREMLEEIICSIEQLTTHAFDITKKHCSSFVADRAKAYWYPSIIMALNNSHSYLGSCGATIQEVADSLSDEEGEEDE